MKKKNRTHMYLLDRFKAISVHLGTDPVNKFPVKYLREKEANKN